jgi:hypothetical protein
MLFIDISQLQLITYRSFTTILRKNLTKIQNSKLNLKEKEPSRECKSFVGKRLNRKRRHHMERGRNQVNPSGNACPLASGVWPQSRRSLREARQREKREVSDRDKNNSKYNDDSKA